ncbi:MAG TPA: PASTA domain-containing protein, partial [Candidatus Alistipes stercoravium]|nr:PASTA domain-containing protein [Candidatus Alistipes stercoravium]
TPVNIFPREVDFAEWEILRRYPLLNWNMGMVYRLVERDDRVYPQGGLARRTIGDKGYIGRPDDSGKTLFGNYGIEDSYRRELSGRDGVAVRQRIARGFYGRVAGAGHEEPEDGLDVVTTLDMDLQDVADRALRSQLERQNATWGTTIVMETRTGEILALANLGRNADGSFSERENYALSRSMEPGSTFKLATMLTLLDDAHMPVETTYDTHNGDPVQVGPAKNIRDSHRGDHVIDFRRAVASSSNVYFAEAMWDRYGITGKKQQYSYFLHNELHLGETVGLERFGERKPSITTDWKVPDPGVMLVKMAYGYRVRLAPIQMITFYNAIANEGRMISPVLVRELRRGGRVKERFESRTIASSICSRTTLHTVRECLQAVCTEGTASNFFRDTTRVRVAAKTGTAQITDARSREGRYYLGSMIAFFPAEAPRYTVLTTIETRAQAGKAYYGGPLAGPVVKRMVDYIYNREHDWYGRVADDGPRRYPERMKGGDIAQIRRVAGQLSPRVEFDRRKGWGRTAVDSLSRVRITSIAEDRDVMPDVRGMGLKDALFLLESRNLRVRFSGQGAVAQQSIAPGSRISPGASVALTLK